MSKVKTEKKQTKQSKDDSVILNNVEIEVRCPQCGKLHKVYFDIRSNQIDDFMNSDEFLCRKCDYLIR